MVKEVSLRPAVANDAWLLFRWRNDDETRKHSGDQKPFTWMDHKGWFLESLIDPTRTLLIGEASTGSLHFPVGTVRLDLELHPEMKDGRTVSITVDPIMRRMGWGHAMLSKLVEQYGIKPMIAHVRRENTQSLLLFQKCGFKLIQPEDPDWYGLTDDPEWYQLRRDPEPTHFLPLRGSE